MSNYNKVLLMGRLTRDPELRYTPQGTPVSEIGLAINREYMAGNERRKESTFVDVTFWGRQAEVVCQYLKKGGPIFVEGRLSFDSWEAQDGQRRSKLRVVATNFQFIGARSEGEAAPVEGPDESAGNSEGNEGYGAQGGGSNRRTAGGGDWGGSSKQGTGRTSQTAQQGIRGPAGPAASQEPSEEGGNLGVDDSEIPF